MNSFKGFSMIKITNLTLLGYLIIIYNIFQVSNRSQPSFKICLNKPKEECEEKMCHMKQTCICFEKNYLKNNQEWISKENYI